MKTLGTDANGNVLLVSDHQDGIPAEFNGKAITAVILTDEQETQFDALPDDRSATIFSGGIFTAAAKSADTVIKDQISGIEFANPITHRALRELILAIGAIYPDAKSSVFYTKVAATDAEIVPLRAKL